MFDFVDLFDNREKALAIWTTIVLVALLCHRGLRPAVLDVVRSFLQPALLTATFIVLAYTVAVVAVLERMGLWETTVLGMTILWISSAGVAAFWASATNPGDPTLIRKIVGATIAWTLVVEFLANLYVFGLAVELIVLPVFAVIVMVDAVAAMNAEHAPARKLTGIILTSFAIFLVVRAVWMAASDPWSFLTSVNAMRLLVPIALTVAFVPVAYLMAILVLYSRAFARLNALAKDPRSAAVVKRTMVRAFGLNRMRLARFRESGLWTIAWATTRQEVEAGIRESESGSKTQRPSMIGVPTR